MAARSMVSSMSSPSHAGPKGFGPVDRLGDSDSNRDCKAPKACGLPITPSPTWRVVRPSATRHRTVSLPAMNPRRRLWFGYGGVSYARVARRVSPPDSRTKGGDMTMLDDAPAPVPPGASGPKPTTEGPKKHG